MKLTDIESILERSGFKRNFFLDDSLSYESSFCGVALEEDLNIVQVYSNKNTGVISTEIPVELIKTFKATPRELEITFGSRGYILYQK